MDYEEIMQEIKSNLCGDELTDLQYLQTQLDKYKDHELSQEQMGGIGRLIFVTLPEHQKA